MGKRDVLLKAENGNDNDQNFFQHFKHSVTEVKWHLGKYTIKEYLKFSAPQEHSDID